jgi:hypothetical protein
VNFSRAKQSSGLNAWLTSAIGKLSSHSRHRSIRRLSTVWRASKLSCERWGNYILAYRPRRRFCLSYPIVPRRLSRTPSIFGVWCFAPTLPLATRLRTTPRSVRDCGQPATMPRLLRSHDDGSTHHASGSALRADPHPATAACARQLLNPHRELTAP